MRKKEIIELIESRLDHYSPYRPITDSKEMQGARKALHELLCIIDPKNYEE